MTLEEVKDWMADVDPMAFVAIGFVGMIFLLAIYTWRHWAKRKKKLLEMMPRLGFYEMQEPSADQLVPELLFHPNEFSPPQPHRTSYQDLRPRIPLAWQGQLGDWPVVLMDVVVMRLRSGSGNQSDDNRHATFDRTVLRFSLAEGQTSGLFSELPPDLLLREQVLFKNQMKHRRSVHGVDIFGKHHMVFSDAPESQLATWLTPEFQAVLGRRRLWRLAVHDGVVFLHRGMSREEPREMESFLQEGEELLSAFLAGSQKR